MDSSSSDEDSSSGEENEPAAQEYLGASDEIGEDDSVFPSLDTQAVFEKEVAPANDDTKVAIFQTTLSGSLESLSQGKLSTSTELIKNRNIVGIKKGEGLLLEEITLESYSNGFPCSIGISIDGLKGDVLKTFTSNGQKCNYVVYPKSKKSGINVAISSIKVGKEVSFFSRYPGFTIDNLSDGIAYIDKTALIQKSHPVVNMITMDVKANDGNIKKVFKSFSKTHYQADGKLVLDTANALKQSLQSRIPVVKENDLRVSIMRAVTSSTHAEKVYDAKSWKDSLEIYDNVVGEQSKAGMLSKTFNLTTSFKVKYRTIHKGEDKTPE